MRTTLERALNGRDMAESALGPEGAMAPEDYETGLIDALVNLMHFARRYEIDFEDALLSAEAHHYAEAIFGWDQVPDEGEPSPHFVTVKIENAYSDGHTSEREVRLPSPDVVDADGLDEWFDGIVFEHIGDGHGIDNDLGSCFTATIIAADNEAFVGKTHEWID